MTWPPSVKVVTWERWCVWAVDCQEQLVLGHHHAYSSCEAHPMVFQVVSTVVLPITFHSNHGLFSLKVKFT